MNEFEKTPVEVKRDALLRYVSTGLPHHKDPNPCPDDSRLAALAEGKIHGRERRELNNHLASCDPCRESFILLRHLMPPAPGRIRVFRPLALAASLVLVIMIVYVTTIPDSHPGEPFGHTSPSVSRDEINTESPSVEPAPQPSPPHHQAIPASPEKKGSRKARAADFSTTGHDKKFRLTGKRIQAPPVEEKIKEEGEASADAEDLNALTLREKSTSPALRKTRSDPNSVGTVHKWKGGMDPDPGIFPDSPPAGTPPGKIRITLHLTGKGEISAMTFDPETSPLVPPLRNAFRQWAQDSPHRSRRHHFVAVWDGSEWRIQPSSTSGGKRPETSGI